MSTFKLLQYKLFIPLLIMCGGFVIIILFVYLELNSTKSLEKKELLYASESYIKRQNRVFQDLTQHGEKALLALRAHPSFVRYLESGDKDKVQEMFRYTIHAEPYIMQLRFIDTRGMEKIRFNRENIDGNISEVFEEDLQDKSARKYVKDNLFQEEMIRYSALELNIEHGEVENPFNPTYRAILPVWHRNAFKGILVVNYFAEAVVNAIFEAENYNIRILDSEGYVLTSSNTDEAWSRYVEQPFTIDQSIVKHLSANKAVLDESILLPIQAPFANRLWLEVRPTQDYMAYKTELKEENIMELAWLVSLINLFLSVLVYVIINRFNLQLQDSKLKRQLQEELIERHDKIITMSQALDRYVISSTTDLRGIITDVSQAFCDISGYSKEELIGKSHRIVRHPDMASDLYQDLWETIKADHTWIGDIKNRCKDGSYYWVHASISPMYDKNGEKVGYTAVRENITHQKLLEEKQKRLNELALRTNLALEASNIGIWEWEYGTDHILWDERMCEIYDVPLDRPTQTYTDWIAMLLPEERERVGNYLKKVAKDEGEFNTNFWILTAQGQKRYIHSVGKNEFDLNDHSYRMVGVNIDMTKQKNIEDNLHELVEIETSKRLEQTKLMVQQSKFAAMGEMLANIAHQWKQPLMMLSMGVLVLQKKFNKGELDAAEMTEYVHKTNEITAKMNQTILDFSEYFTPKKQMQTFDLSLVIDKSLHFLESMIKKYNISVDKSVKVDDTITLGLENELSQVFFNLIKNSIDAIVENKVQKGHIHITLEASRSNWTIVFSDNGGGFEEDVISHIFEPYFTTKFKDKGTGIGLYMSKMIIEESLQGDIEAKNTDVGAEITISLPRRR